MRGYDNTSNKISTKLTVTNRQMSTPHGTWTHTLILKQFREAIKWIDKSLEIMAMVNTCTIMSMVDIAEINLNK